MKRKSIMLQWLKELFKIAEEAIKTKPGLKVIIVKRLPRFDRSSQDIIGIKSKISSFANSVLDQEWIRHGSPSNIHIIELRLNIEGSQFLKSLIYGKANSDSVDGIHLRGAGASRHFTYRAVQAIKQVLLPSSNSSRNNFSRRENNENDHTNCPQAKYRKAQYNHYPSDRQAGSHGSRNTGRPFHSRQFQSQYKTGSRTYADAASQGPTRNTFSGENIFNHLNC